MRAQPAKYMATSAGDMNRSVLRDEQIELEAGTCKRNESTKVKSVQAEAQAKTNRAAKAWRRLS